MNKHLMGQFIISIYIYCSIIIGAESQEYKTDLRAILPQAGDVDSWVPDGETQFEIGQDLFLLINGGAAIYHEYGFKSVIFQSYRNKEGKSINLEIYEMNNQDAAYGIYTFKTGSEGEVIKLGYEGWLDSYYLNFWEGNFLITVIGLGSDNEILDGLKKIAKAVDLKIKVKSKRPAITQYLPKENLQANGITYLNGNLALFNQYKFVTKDVFGLQEGVIGKYDNYSIFIFQYESQVESKRWYEVAKNNLKDNNNYENFVDKISLFEIDDMQNNKLSIKLFQNWILIILGNNETHTEIILKSLEKILTK